MSDPGLFDTPRRPKFLSSWLLARFCSRTMTAGAAREAGTLRGTALERRNVTTAGLAVASKRPGGEGSRPGRAERVHASRWMRNPRRIFPLACLAAPNHSGVRGEAPGAVFSSLSGKGWSQDVPARVSSGSSARHFAMGWISVWEWGHASDTFFGLKSLVG